MSSDEPTNWDRFLEAHARQKQQLNGTDTPGGSHNGHDDVVAVVQMSEARASRYAARALEFELANVASAAEGRRNDALNAAAFALGQLVGAGVLDELATCDALATTALAAGLTGSETARTISSGMRAGKQEPRELPASALAQRDAGGSSSEAPFGIVAGSPPVEPPSVEELDDFWASRELLTHLRVFARARMTSPWAVLGVTLARIVAATPPTWVLPPIVGGEASLNLFVGLVGTSGSGKGAAERVADDAFRVSAGERFETLTTGSGEGIAHAYVKRNRDGVVDQHTHAVLFTIPEIDTLSALGSRQGATLMPELRRGWSGEALGFAYSDPSKRLLVPAHSYRMCLVAGIQPARARTLLDDADGGTPQRFGWFTAIDRTAPNVLPDAPMPLAWKPPRWMQDDHRNAFSGRYRMGVCEIARTTIIDARRARNRGDGDALDGHLLLAQLKTAAALALAEGRVDIDDDDWRLADIITRQSSAVRASVAQALTLAVAEHNRVRAEQEADRAIIVDVKTSEARQKRCVRAILRSIAKHGSRASSDLRKDIAHRDRDGFEGAMELLLASGQIVEEALPNGARYSKG